MAARDHRPRGGGRSPHQELFTGPDSLRRSIALATLRPAGCKGVPYTDLAAVLGPDVDDVIAQLRARGHVIQTRMPDNGLVILHELTPTGDAT